MNSQKTLIILETEQLLSIPRAAEILGVHFTTVYRRVKNGDLRIIRIGKQTYVETNQIKEMAKINQP